MMNDKLTIAYKQLIHKVIDVNSTMTKKKLTVCPSIAGGQNAKIMIVGRCINSWCAFPEGENIDMIFSQIQHCNQCTLDWVIGKNHYTNCHCKRDKKPENVPTKKCEFTISKSKFWQFARYIVEKELPDTKDWIKEIVWNDLYKSSYITGGNPNGYYNFQKELCDNILLEEIKYYQPKAIYFTTEVTHKKKEGNSKQIIPYWFSREDFPCTYAYLENDFKGHAFLLQHPQASGNFDETFARKVNIKQL